MAVYLPCLILVDTFKGRERYSEGHRQAGGMGSEEPYETQKGQKQSSAPGKK